ncbi:MAG: hypothetical protein AAF078_13440 [Planctomycetota bacterium]
MDGIDVSNRWSEELERAADQVRRLRRQRSLLSESERLRGVLDDQVHAAEHRLRLLQWRLREPVVS